MSLGVLVQARTPGVYSTVNAFTTSATLFTLRIFLSLLRHCG